MLTLDDQGLPKQLFLKKAQKQKLFDIFMNVDTLHHCDIGLVDVVLRLNDSVLLENLKRLLPKTSEDDVWWMQSFFHVVVALADDPKLEKILNELEEVTSAKEEEKDLKKQKDLYRQFIVQMKHAKLRKNFCC